jgi:hypothetical protein
MQGLMRIDFQSPPATAVDKKLATTKAAVPAATVRPAAEFTVAR